MNSSSFVPGNIYAIDSERGNFYFSMSAFGGDFVFLEYQSVYKIPPKTQQYFMRLMISYPSIRRANWELIDRVHPTIDINTASPYLHKPVGGKPQAYDPITGRTRALRSGEIDKLEDLASWDADQHILPLMRFHFLREATPFAALVKSGKL